SSNLPANLQDIKFDSSNLNIVLMGTSVVIGYATIYVVRTGKRTELGKISETLLKNITETDFEKNIKKFTLFISRLIGVMIIFIFLSNILLARSFMDSFLFAIAVAVSLTPELLPVIISVSLAYGAKNMAKKEVIVRRLSSIENFGSMNILCTDKTGTLTENHITVVKYIDLNGNASNDVLLYSYISSSFRTAQKNPLDEAIKEYKKFDIKNYKKIDEIPFDFERKRDSIVFEKNNHRFLITKGAPENIYSLCHLKTEELSQAKITFEKLSQDGFKVLAIALKEVHELKNNYSKNDEFDMDFIGFIAFFDPPKKTAEETLKDLKNNGVEIKILTGDNEILTKKICQELNLKVKDVLRSEDLDKLSDEELEKVINNVTIFSRITPLQKQRIIKILRKLGNTVGYLGDGINDAPALKEADISISVNNACDIAKEVSDIILLRHSLNVIRDGVLEGRKTFENTMKYIRMVFSSNFGGAFSMMFSPLILPFLPMQPTQILLNNFLYDLSQTTIPTDNIKLQEIKKPTHWNFKEILRFMFVFGIISSLFDFITFAVLLLMFHAKEFMFQTGWFIESIATQTFVIYIIRTKLPFYKSPIGKLLVLSTVSVVAIAWLIPLLPIGKYFNFVALPLNLKLMLVVVIVAYLLVVELVKSIFYKKNNAKNF
ncbi:MAG: magnesium-translocating P-type ATPase, partial [Minisyncoccia bacterium]